MVSHKYKCIFIHIPKCAGTSIEKALDHFDGKLSRGRQDHRSVRMIEKPFNPFKAARNPENAKDAIRRFREYFRSSSNPNNKLAVSSAQYKDYYKFSFVRNPWDRAFSWYKNAMRDPIHQKNYGIPAQISFDEFIKTFAGTGYLREQTYWLDNYSNKIDLDFVGKFENLATDFDNICKAIGLSDRALPHEVKSNEASKTEYISAEAAEFISMFYQREIELFDYQFDRDCSLKIATAAADS
ncbi:MAG: hypothetical protein ACI97K_002331 [Glaciecola sp.]